jgi:PAS domain S-box-containing protein
MSHRRKVFLIFSTAFLAFVLFLLLFSFLHLKGVRDFLKEQLLYQGNIAASHYTLTSHLPETLSYDNGNQGFFIIRRNNTETYKNQIVRVNKLTSNQKSGSAVFTESLRLPDGKAQNCLVYLHPLTEENTYLGSYISLEKINSLYYQYFGIFSGICFVILGMTGTVFIRSGGGSTPVFKNQLLYSNEIHNGYSEIKEEQEDDTAWWLEKEIRDHKRDVERLKETQRTLRTLIGNLPGIIYRSLDVEKQNLLYISSGVRGLTGYEPDDLIYLKRETWKSRVPQEEWELLVEEIEESVNRGKNFTVDYTYITKDGQRKKFLEQGQPICSADGKIRYIEGFIYDITAQKKIEEALLESNKNLATTLTSIGDGVVVTDEEGIIGKINPAAQEIAGLSNREALGRFFGDVFSFIILGGGNSCDPIEEVKRTDSIYEEEGYVLFTSARGKKHYGALTAAPIRDTNGIVIVIKDQTVRYHIESALQSSNERFKTLFEFAPDGLALADYRTGRYLEGNRKLLSLFGITKEELSLCYIGDFLSSIDGIGRTDIKIYTKKKIQSVDLQDELNLGEVKIRSRHGEEIECELRMVKFIEGGRTVIRLSLLDIRERKKAQREEKLKEQKLLQADKLASVGQLAAGIAHEIAQPLSGISMTAEYLIYTSDDPSNKEDVKDRMYTILQYIDRIQSITKHVRMFSREQTSSPDTTFSVNEAVTNSRSLVSNQYRRLGINVDMDLDMNISPIIGNVYRLEQVIINLLSNAKDALEEMGEDNGDSKRIFIKTYHEDKWVCIDVRDNGVGIKKEDMEKVFDPFYTTKGVEEGTGLGLSIVNGILKEMKGAMEIESVPGEYTVMKLRFPAQLRG